MKIENDGDVIDVGNGATVVVRELTRSQMVRLQQHGGAVGQVSGEDAKQASMMEGMIRMAVVGADGLSLGKSKPKPVKFATVEHPVLGVVAATSVFDAIPQDAIEKIIQAATGQTGNTTGN